MKMLKVRRLGDSNIVVLPRELEKLGYVPGKSVLVKAEANGDVRIVPADRVESLVSATIRDVALDNAEALEILARHDQEESSSGSPPAAAGG
jgi:antitoxin component of MazEF toxin-antitoxin module